MDQPLFPANLRNPTLGAWGSVGNVGANVRRLAAGPRSCRKPRRPRRLVRSAVAGALRHDSQPALGVSATRRRALTGFHEQIGDIRRNYLTGAARGAEISIAVLAVRIWPFLEARVAGSTGPPAWPARDSRASRRRAGGPRVLSGRSQGGESSAVMERSLTLRRQQRWNGARASPPRNVSDVLAGLLVRRRRVRFESVEGSVDLEAVAGRCSPASR